MVYTYCADFSSLPLRNIVRVVFRTFLGAAVCNNQVCVHDVLAVAFRHSFVQLGLIAFAATLYNVPVFVPTVVFKPFGFVKVAV